MPYRSGSTNLSADLLVVACAVSAGIHGALVPEHFEEGTGAGVGFVVATVALAALALLLTYRPTGPVLIATVAVLGGLIVAYALVVVAGVPVLHPEQEAVEPLAVATKAVEALGFVLAATLLPRPALDLISTRPKGTTS